MSEVPERQPSIIDTVAGYYGLLQDMRANGRLALEPYLENLDFELTDNAPQAVASLAVCAEFYARRWEESTQRAMFLGGLLGLRLVQLIPKPDIVERLGHADFERAVQARIPETREAQSVHPGLAIDYAGRAGWELLPEDVRRRLGAAATAVTRRELDASQRQQDSEAFKCGLGLVIQVAALAVGREAGGAAHGTADGSA